MATMYSAAPFTLVCHFPQLRCNEPRRCRSLSPKKEATWYSRVPTLVRNRSEEFPEAVVLGQGRVLEVQQKRRFPCKYMRWSNSQLNMQQSNHFPTLSSFRQHQLSTQKAWNASFEQTYETEKIGKRREVWQFPHWPHATKSQYKWKNHGHVNLVSKGTESIKIDLNIHQWIKETNNNKPATYPRWKPDSGFVWTEGMVIHDMGEIIGHEDEIHTTETKLSDL